MPRLDRPPACPPNCRRKFVKCVDSVKNQPETLEVPADGEPIKPEDASLISVVKPPVALQDNCDYRRGAGRRGGGFPCAGCCAGRGPARPPLLRQLGPRCGAAKRAKPLCLDTLLSCPCSQVHRVHRVGRLRQQPQDQAVLRLGADGPGNGGACCSCWWRAPSAGRCWTWVLLHFLWEGLCRAWRWLT